MSIESLIEKSDELRLALDMAETIDDKIFANCQLAGFLAAVNEIIPLIGVDAAERILIYRRAA